MSRRARQRREPALTWDDSTRQAVAEVAELRGRLDTAADDHADGTLDREQFHRITGRLRPRLEAAHARARVIDPTPLVAELVEADDVQAVCDDLPLSRERGVVDLLLNVRVLRTTSGARTFDPEGVEVTWRSS